MPRSTRSVDREWLTHNNATVLFVLFLVIGVKVLGTGLGLFA